MFKKIIAYFSLSALVSFLTSTAAFAEVDVTAITELSTDVATIGAAVMGVLIAIAGIKYIRRAL